MTSTVVRWLPAFEIADIMNQVTFANDLAQTYRFSLTA